MPIKSKQNYKPGLKDLCQTPAYALSPISRELFMYGRNRPATIWECAAGEGYLARGLESLGFRVIYSDISYGIDFLSDELPGGKDQYDVIVTNPPFSLKYEFLKRCYELEKPFALLMPVDVLGAAKGQRLLEKYSGTCVLLSKRINFKMPNMGWKGSGSDFPVAWFTKGLFDDEFPNYRLKFYNYDWLTDDVRKEFET